MILIIDNEIPKVHPNKEDGADNRGPQIPAQQARPTPDPDLQREIEEALAKAEGKSQYKPPPPPLPPSLPRPPQRKFFGFRRNNMATGDASTPKTQAREESFKEGVGIPPEFEEKPRREGERRQFVLKQPNQERPPQHEGPNQIPKQPRYNLRPRYEPDPSDPRSFDFRRHQTSKHNPTPNTIHKPYVKQVYRPPVEPPKKESFRPPPQFERGGDFEQRQIDKHDGPVNRVGSVPDQAPFRPAPPQGYRLVCQRVPLGSPARTFPNQFNTIPREAQVLPPPLRFLSPAQQGRLARDYIPGEGYVPPQRANPFLPARVSRVWSGDRSRAAEPIGDFVKATSAKPKSTNPFLPEIKKADEKKP